MPETSKQPKRVSIFQPQTHLHYYINSSHLEVPALRSKPFIDELLGVIGKPQIELSVQLDAIDLLHGVVKLVWERNGVMVWYVHVRGVWYSPWHLDWQYPAGWCWTWGRSAWNSSMDHPAECGTVGNNSHFSINYYSEACVLVGFILCSGFLLEVESFSNSTSKFMFTKITFQWHVQWSITEANFLPYNHTAIIPACMFMFGTLQGLDNRMHACSTKWSLQTSIIADGQTILSPDTV